MMNDPLLESCGYYCEDVFVCFLLLTCCPNQNPLRCGVALLSGKEPQTQECLNSSPGARACPAPGRTHKSAPRYQRNGQQKDKALAYSRFSSEYEDLAALSDGKSFW